MQRNRDPITFILTLGFDTSVLTKLIGEHGLRPNDEVIIVKSRVPHPKATEALKEAKDFINMISPETRVHVLELDETNIEEDVATLTNAILQSKNPVIDISGGPRALGLALYIAAGLAGIKEVSLKTETTGIKIKLKTIPLTQARNITPRQAQVAQLLPAKPLKIAKQFKISKSAATRHLQKLVAKGIATKQPGGKYEPTPITKAIISLTKQQKQQ